MDVTIRPYREEDRTAVTHITEICFDGVSMERNIETLFGPIAGHDWTWRKNADVCSDIDQDPQGVLVAELNGDVVGYITTRSNRDTAIGSIPNLAVLPACQKTGIGRKLLDAAMTRLRKNGMQYVRIETLEQNAVGQHFYPNLGFREFARQIHYIMPLEQGKS